MKKLLIILVLLTGCTKASGIKRILTHKDTVSYKRVIEAIIKVESGGNITAKSECGTYIGILQISPIVVRDCNEYLRLVGSSTRYTLQDRYNPKKSKEMFYITQKRYNPTRDLGKSIRIWNGGPNYSKKSTNKYYRKVINEFIKQ